MKFVVTRENLIKAFKFWQFEGGESVRNNQHSTRNSQPSTVNPLLQIVAVMVFSILLTSCTQNEDDYGPQTDTEEVSVPQKERTIILNEGNFMFGNGSVSVLDNNTGFVANEVFKTANSYPLGDVPQSMLIHDSLAYIVVNNSGKIEVLDNANFASVKTITGFTSPRQMAIVNEDPLTAWVTDLYANKIWEVDLDQGIITRNFALNGWNENVLIHNLNAYVLNKKDSVIYVLDVASGTKKHTYNLGDGIVDFRQWSENELMVLAKDGLYKINMLNFVVDTVYSFPVARTPLRMAVDTTKNIVYFLENEVYQFEYDLPQPSVELFIDKPLGSNFYGLEVNSQNSFVFVTDAKDYVQQGELLIFDALGNEMGKFKVGVNPQFMVFD